MITVIGMWISTIVTGMWLLAIRPAQVFDIRSCHLLPSSDLNRQAIVSHLPEVQLAQLKTTWDNREDALFNLGRRQELLHLFEQTLVVNPSHQNAQRDRLVVLH